MDEKYPLNATPNSASKALDCCAEFSQLQSPGRSDSKDVRIATKKRLKIRQCGGLGLRLASLDDLPELRLGRGWLPEFDLVAVGVVDPGEAAVGFVHALGVYLYSLFFQAG